MARLPEAPQKLLSAVALAGQPISRAATAIAVYRDEAGPIEELLVYHDRIREAVVAGLPPAYAAARHLRLFQGLLCTGHAEPEQMVFHLLHGGGLEGAARYAVEASAQAYRALAYHQAVRLCRVALSTDKLSAADALLVKARLADALVGAGYPREAAGAYLELADAEPAEQSFKRRRQAAKQFLISGHVQEGTQVLRGLLPAARLRIPETSLGLYLSLGRLRRLAEKAQPYLKDAIERGRKSQEINARLNAAFLLLLREDEPERAEASVQATLLRVAHAEAISPQYVALEAQILICLYEGRAADAWRLYCEQHRSVLRSGILRVGLFRAMWDGIIALLVLASGQPVSIAESAARRLLRSRCQLAGPLSGTARALSQRRLGQHAESLVLLQQAEEGLSACDMSLHAACARFRRGQWLSGVAGQELSGAELVQSAREQMSREGVKSPERMAAMLVPDPPRPV